MPNNSDTPFHRALRIETVHIPGRDPARLQVVDGSISQLRIAVPSSDECARFRLGELLVQVPLDSSGSSAAILRSLSVSGKTVTACLADTKDCGTQLCWLLDEAAGSIVPLAYDTGERDWRSLRKAGLIVILSAVALAISIRYLFSGGAWMLVPLLLSSSALMFSLASSSFSMLSLRIERRNRPVLVQAKRLLDRYGGKDPGQVRHG
ncbi:hypothetical protein [Rhizobium binxianense]